jgi:hypothetical protein
MMLPIQTELGFHKVPRQIIVQIDLLHDSDSRDKLIALGIDTDGKNGKASEYRECNST